MSLIWHIVRKDFRRLAAPLGLWLLLVLGHAWLLFEWEGQMGTNPTAFEGKRYFVNTCGGIVAGIGFVLAAWMVMEDSLVSTRAFWRTRALSGGRLLVAKAVGTLLMFSVLPVVVLTPIWLWCGFSLREWYGAALEWGLIQAVCSLLALALGSITETSGQFIVRTVGAAIILPVGLAFAVPSSSAASDYLNATRAMLVTNAVFLCVMLTVAHQFLTRRLVRSWLLLGVGFVLIFCLGRWWPWDLSPEFRESDRGEDGAAAVITASLDRLPPQASTNMESRTTEVRGQFAGVPAGTYVRVNTVRAEWLAGNAGNAIRATRVVPTPGLAPELVRGAAGLPGGGSLPADWAANIRFPDLKGETDPELRAELQASLMRGRVLGELPLQAGGELRVGSSLTRIKSVRWVDDNLVVLLEERDAWLLDAGRYSGSYNPRFRRIRPVEDGFVIVNRTQGSDLLPGVREIGTIRSNSVVVGRRELIIQPPAGAMEGEEGKLPGWLEGAVIVKVRFAPEVWFTRIVAGRP